MEVDATDGAEIGRLQALLQTTRAQLARAMDEASELQAWSGSDEVRGRGLRPKDSVFRPIK